ncbi:hypothetical protein [Pseudoalteromonas phage PH357]|nr:hypothetical protein [Pseudoalteromonas phage PH357]
MKRQRIYINPSHADILSLIKSEQGMCSLGEVVEFVLEQYLHNNNNYELTELLNDARREQEQ